jgi:hypothetical protein
VLEAIDDDVVSQSLEITTPDSGLSIRVVDFQAGGKREGMDEDLTRQSSTRTEKGWMLDYLCRMMSSRRIKNDGRKSPEIWW